MLRAGPTNKLVFISFILDLMKQLSQHAAVDASKVLLYMDNATYHTSADVLELFRLLKVNYVFAPAYLSPLNPIEYFFGLIKGKLKHYDIVKK